MTYDYYIYHGDHFASIETSNQYSVYQELTVVGQLHFKNKHIEKGIRFVFTKG